ncbi:MAG: hypothetical protein HC855_07185 [Rhizobiales bacterium]|nr:hypothetical protein [Hyphomicrobiales bacterium]
MAWITLLLLAAGIVALVFRPDLLRASLFESNSDYRELGIGALPRSVAMSRAVQPYLNRLSREHCDREAILPLADGLKATGHLREAANALVSFVDRCKGPNEYLDPAVEDFLALSDFEKAFQLADRLVREDPSYGRYRYLRALSAEKLGNLQQSLIDHIDALALLGNPANVHSSVFYDLALAYDRLGRHCEAITPIQQWAAYDPARYNPQTRKLIEEFSKKETAVPNTPKSTPFTPRPLRAMSFWHGHR